MKITIDPYILDKYNLTIEEFMVLYLNAVDFNIQEINKSLVNKGLAMNNLHEDNKLIIGELTQDLITSVVIDSNENIINKDQEFLDLATKMRELYPSGRKPGTTYYWRSTISEVVQRLKRLRVKYGYEFTEDQVLRATKKYIDMYYHSNPKGMRLLKYFIIKANVEADDSTEVISDLMAIIENESEDQNDDNNVSYSDWMSTLK